ncbi:MAG: hypothetical protein OXE41_06830 [Gammaproteobacteria bacterium]|nr:hypothetical protein [Gammaproteobacteria bacterium]MCY4219827.1 hypothetical protein [Gammaproteobacteria bacterium]MCY4275091.1 hypothetical protein [Gammaproteobacteria bacterium]
MQKLKKLGIKQQKAKRRIQFAMHTGFTLGHNQARQAVIPEIERYRFERFSDDDESERAMSEFS